MGLSCHPLLWPFLGLPWLGWVLTWAALLQDLHKKYSYIRKTRPDGNCFYRAFGFSHLEALLDDSKELQRYAGGGRAGAGAAGGGGFPLNLVGGLVWAGLCGQTLVLLAEKPMLASHPFPPQVQGCVCQE